MDDTKHSAFAATSYALHTEVSTWLINPLGIDRTAPALDHVDDAGTKNAGAKAKSHRLRWLCTKTQIFWVVAALADVSFQATRTNTMSADDLQVLSQQLCLLLYIS